MAKVCDVFNEQQQQQPQHPTMVAPTPPPRRPRVREVSSRFMSPVVASSSASSTSTSGDLHLPAPKCSLHRQATVLTSSDDSNLYNYCQRSRSVQRTRQATETEPLRCSNENRLDIARSLETPLAASNARLNLSSQLRPQRSLKLLKENGGDLQQQQRQHFPGRSGSLGRNRPETPLPSLPSYERRTPHPKSISNSHQQTTNTSSTARQLVQLCGMEPSVNSNGSSEVTTTSVPENEDSAVIDPSSGTSDHPSIAAVETREEDGICSTSNPSLGEDNYCKMPTSVLDIRCSMPGPELPSHSSTTMSSRSIPQRGCSGNAVADSFKVPAVPFNRLLNSPVPSCEPSFCYTNKFLHKSLCKPQPTPSRSGSNCLPPHPSSTKAQVDARKGKKALSNVEHVHTLRLLHNRYLQWRYANAKAEATMNVQLHTVERSFYALLVQKSELHDSVQRKRIELGYLKKMATISSILGAQIPYLDEWSTFECEYSSSLSGAIKALQDASVQLPISGSVKVNIGELEESLKSALKLMESVSSQVHSFLPKAKKVDTSISSLAEMVSEERALIEECGDLLTKMHNLQVEECSLRGQLIQLRKKSSCQQDQ